jgi:hypothetical protein
MAYVLYLCEARLYFLIITPAILAVPVLGMLLLAVYFGRCRNPLLAGGLGLLLMTFLYGGYWLFSYQFNVRVYGPMAQAQLSQIAGESGFLGYLILRCKMTPLGVLTDSQAIIARNLAGRGLELGILLAMGLYAGRRLARRAYFEDYGRWASSVAFLFPPDALPIVREVIEQQEWSRLDSVRKKSVTADERRAGGMLFRVEYLPRSVDQPAYITIEGAALGRMRPLLAILPALGRWVTRVISRLAGGAFTSRRRI